MPILGYIVLLVVSTAITMALMPKPKQPSPASANDFTVPTAEEGRPIPVVFGTVRITGPNVLWYGNIEAYPNAVNPADEVTDSGSGDSGSGSGGSPTDGQGDSL